MHTNKWIMLSVVTVVAALLLAPVGAWSQPTLAKVEGKITDNGKPMPNVAVIYTNNENGKTFQMKTEKDGRYFGVGFPVAEYRIQVMSATGETLFNINKVSVTIEGGANFVKDIDITKDSASGSGGPAPKYTKEQIEAIKEQNAKAMSMNALISQAQTALNAKNWADAVPPLQQMIAADPKRWEFYQALGNAQFNLGQYQDTIDTLEKGIPVAQNTLAANDPKNDPVKVKAALGQMLASEGNSYLKLNKTPEAIASFEKAAAMDPNPSVAYFNLCATQYNMGQMAAAAAACDKAIAADPNKADAYFIKGSAMFGNGKLGADNKYTVPPGTVEALSKYLQLAPTGAHAADVKAMLDSLGQKIETTYKGRKK